MSNESGRKVVNDRAAIERCIAESAAMWWRISQEKTSFVSEKGRAFVHLSPAAIDAAHIAMDLEGLVDETRRDIPDGF